MDNNIEEPTVVFFENLDELLEKAKEEADKVDAGLKESVKLYFIARYFVAIFEARYGKIPIQVWNEYRNALDHYFRWQTTKKSSGDTHRGRMERHLQRAALDILKIFVHETILTIEEWHSKFSIEVYNLVDNGKFRPEFIELEKKVRANFEEAKISDSILGESDEDDDKVLAMYLNAAYAADSLKLKLLDRQTDFERAQSIHQAIHNAAHKHSFFEHLKIYFVFYIGWTILIFALAWVWNLEAVALARNQFWKDVYCYFSEW